MNAKTYDRLWIAVAHMSRDDMRKLAADVKEQPASDREATLAIIITSLIDDAEAESYGEDL